MNDFFKSKSLTVSRFGVSYGSPDATVANAKTAESGTKIVYGVEQEGAEVSL